VTGATGNTGCSLGEVLRAHGVAVRAMVRSSGTAPRFGDGAEEVVADFDDTTSNVALSTGSKSLPGHTVVATNPRPSRSGSSTSPRKAGCATSSKLSQFAAAPDSPVRLRYHAAVEQRLRDSGMDYTMLQPNLYFQGCWPWRALFRARQAHRRFPLTSRGVADRDPLRPPLGSQLNSPNERRCLRLGGAGPERERSSEGCPGLFHQGAWVVPEALTPAIAVASWLALPRTRLLEPDLDHKPAGPGTHWAAGSWDHPLVETGALRLRLLGGAQAWDDGTPCQALASPRIRSLVTYLVLHRDVTVPRQRLAFAFWPDSGEAQARTNLRNLLHVTRRTHPVWPRR
jgi:uncharacterized protein YbjT (DUF2867 family)